MKLLGDIKKYSWSMIEEEEPDFCLNIFIGFRKNTTLPVKFKDLSFGITVYQGEKEIFSAEEPSTFNYIATDQDYIFGANISGLIPGKEYLLKVWANNDSTNFKSSFTYIATAPKQPYPSWIYDEETYVWSAPVPHPNDGKIYVWDEKKIDWSLTENL